MVQYRHTVTDSTLSDETCHSGLQITANGDSRKSLPAKEGMKTTGDWPFCRRACAMLPFWIHRWPTMNVTESELSRDSHRLHTYVHSHLSSIQDLLAKADSAPDSLSPYRQRVPLIVSRFPPFTPSKRGDRKLSRQGERERYISVHSTSRLPPSSSVHLKPPRPRHWTLSCSPPAWLWDIAPQLPSFLPSLPLGFCERSVSGPSGLYLRA
ncbi:hypothetical protein IWX49DRAFT_91511 [Phyllosticta citricarpa]